MAGVPTKTIKAVSKIGPLQSGGPYAFSKIIPSKPLSSLTQDIAIIAANATASYQMILEARKDRFMGDPLCLRFSKL